MEPYYDTENGKLYHGDVLDVLKELPDQSVNCCVTSPPYWGLRDYGNDAQIGLESTPELYVEKMVDVFDEVRRVLTDDGTCWLNLGDSYAANRGYQVPDSKHVDVGNSIGMKASNSNLKPKDLVGIPWRVAFALQSAGWYLRQDIIWHKPNPMPESVKDRCTKAHEYIFLLSKSQQYFCDMDAIREPSKDKLGVERFKNGCGVGDRSQTQGWCGGKVTLDKHREYNPLGRNRHSVWTVSTKPFSGAHFAVFPPDLIEPCILAGCPKGGTVIDPFIGSGTTAIVAYKHDRKFIGIELNQKYLDEIAVPRIDAETRQLRLF